MLRATAAARRMRAVEIKIRGRSWLRIAQGAKAAGKLYEESQGKGRETPLDIETSKKLRRSAKSKAETMS